MKFWHGKKVLLTGHTGFKGSWLSLWLQSLGAELIGFSLPPPTNPNLFEAAQLANGMVSILGDIQHFAFLKEMLNQHQPEIIIHMAAQSLVRRSYQAPLLTYATNAMGTVNLLEAVRTTPSVRVIVCVTSDKCYENREWEWGYRENEAMGGHDPYSNSKACAELMSAAYRHSFFKDNGIALATARAGNVIGGGDWSEDRLVPDILNAIEKKSILMVRNPLATRPWQYVLEPLSGYLLLAEKLWEKGDAFASAWNFGPSIESVRPVKWIIEQLAAYYGSPIHWQQSLCDPLHEAHSLALDSSKARHLLGWKPQWNLAQALLEIATWHKAWTQKKDIREKSLQQIAFYTSVFNRNESEIQTYVT